MNTQKFNVRTEAKRINIEGNDYIQVQSSLNDVRNNIIHAYTTSIDKSILHLLTDDEIIKFIEALKGELDKRSDNEH